MSARTRRWIFPPSQGRPAIMSSITITATAYFPLDSIDPATGIRVGYKTVRRARSSARRAFPSLPAVCVSSVCEDTGGLSGTEYHSLCNLWSLKRRPRNQARFRWRPAEGAYLAPPQLQLHDDGFRQVRARTANQEDGGEVSTSRVMMICGFMWIGGPRRGPRRYAPVRLVR